MILLGLTISWLGPGPAEAQNASRNVEVVSLPAEVRTAAGFDPADSAGLFVGVRDFQDPEIAEIPYAVDDAIDLAHLFAVELELITPKKVTLCLAGEPAKAESKQRRTVLVERGARLCTAGLTELYSEIQRLRTASGPRGLVVVALASHGFSEDGADTIAARDSLLRRLRQTGMSLSALLDDLSQTGAPRRLLLVDACRERLTASRSVGQDPSSALGQAFLDALDKARGTAVLMGTVLGGYSYNDHERQAGVFTSAVIDGLQGAAPGDGQGLITVQKLASYVNDHVASWVARHKPRGAAASPGITQILGETAGTLPLAISPQKYGDLARYRQRRDAALDRLARELAARRITGAFYDDVSRALSAESPTSERSTLLEGIEKLDGSQWAAQSLVSYFDEHRVRLLRSLHRQAGELENVRGMPFRYIPAGTFIMGSPENEQGRDKDETQHPVAVNRGFWMAETEVTQAQWQEVMGNNPAYFKDCGANCPVEKVNWYEALEFANALSKKAGLEVCYRFSGGNGRKAGEGLEYEEVHFEGLDCEGFRLPLETEWEYAARAGTKGAIYTGKLTLVGKHNGPELDDIAWYGGNSGVSYEGGFACASWPERQYPAKTCGTHPVGMKKANSWYLRDMLGNVWEWVWNGWGRPSPYAPGSVVVRSQGDRLIRGGSWWLSPRSARVAFRLSAAPSDRKVYLGFRVARSVP